MENPTVIRRQAQDLLARSAAAQRIAGLQELERAGDFWPQTRQLVIDDICRYLSKPVPRNDTEEPMVRRAAQEILSMHLGSPSSPVTWEHKRLNLSGARLFDLDLSDCRLTNADFSGTYFNGDTRFDHAWFHGEARFESARFNGNVSFENTWFHDEAMLDAEFNREARFNSAWFKADAWFGTAAFAADTSFDNARFNRDVVFAAAEFAAGAGFRQADFSEGASFAETSFAGTVSFEDAEFDAYAHFDLVGFDGGVGFAGARFRGVTSFEDARFGSSPCLDGAEFSEEPTGLADPTSASSPVW